MEGTVVLAVFALLGCFTSQNVNADQLSRQKRDQLFLTTPVATTETPVPSTAISLSPQTSISVHHTIVRNKPAYPYPYTETTLQPEGTEDTSYYYTYEDVSEEASKQVTSTITTTPPATTVKPTTKSFWNSQKALLDARRKEGSAKFMPTYSKPSSAPKETKSPIEFKVREKPKFGLANKNRLTTTSKKPEIVTTSKPLEVTTNKLVKSDAKSSLPIQNLSEKDLLKTLKNSNLLPNQLLGRVGDIPVQSNLASQVQSPLKAQSTNINTYGSSRPSKFDSSLRNMQFVDNARTVQQSSLPNLQNLQNNQPLLTNLKPQPLLNLNQQRSAPLNLNQQAQSSAQAIQNLLNQQPLLNLNQNQQPLLNLNQNQQPLLNLNQNQQPLLNLNQQPRANDNPSLGNTFIAASAPLGNSGRSGEVSIQAPSSLLQRLGALGLGGTGGSGNNVVVSRDGGGGYGDNKGFTLNLGPVPDPLTFFLRLLQLIPRPLLDLHGRIFFGIELGKNAGIVSGSGAGAGAKPYSG